MELQDILVKKIKFKANRNNFIFNENRGPDASHYLHFKVNNKNLYLFHTRLKIIDLKIVLINHLRNTIKLLSTTVKYIIFKIKKNTHT